MVGNLQKPDRRKSQHQTNRETDAYFLDNRIRQLSHDQNDITAMVDGTRPYRVVLTITPAGLDGYCNCPASSNIEFCKHCVAVALYLHSGDLTEHVPPADSSLQLIDSYLLTLSTDDLRSLLLNAAKQHEQTQEALLMKARLAQGQLSLKELKKLITAGSPAQDVWGYADVTAYYNRFEQVLENIQELADEVRPRLNEKNLTFDAQIEDKIQLTGDAIQKLTSRSSFGYRPVPQTDNFIKLVGLRAVNQV